MKYAITLGIIAALAASAHAGDGECGGKWKHRAGQAKHHVKKMAKKLDLDDKQKDQLKAIMKAKKEKIKAKRAELRKQAKAQRKATEAEIRAILNDEQKKKFDAMIAKRQEKMKERKARILERLSEEE